MESTPINEAIAWLQKANADLEPELLGAEYARELLAAYVRGRKARVVRQDADRAQS